MQSLYHAWQVHHLNGLLHPQPPALNFNSSGGTPLPAKQHDDWETNEIGVSQLPWQRFCAVIENNVEEPPAMGRDAIEMMINLQGVAVIRILSRDHDT